MKNYVSITAARDKDEVNAVLSGFEGAGYSLEDDHVPVVGIQVSEKTFNGIKPKNLRFAPFKEIPSLFELLKGKAIPIIHYNTKNQDTLADQVERTMSPVYDLGCRTVQINVNWPIPEEIEKIKNRFDDIKISLQIDYREFSVEDVLQKARSYGRLLDYLLLDPSRGRGDDFDMEKSVSIYSKLKSSDYYFVFAGGFGPDNAEKVLNDLIEKIGTKDFSICAEGKLRDVVSHEHWGMDILNADKMKTYLKLVKRVLG